MKTSAALIRAAGVLLLISTAAMGQEAASSRSPVPKLISVTFAGGTAAEYISAVRKAAGDEVNILAEPEAGEVQMPPVTLREVTVTTALWLLDDKVHRSRDRAVTLHVSPPALSAGERPTFQVLARVEGRSRSVEAQVWTVANLLGEQDLTSRKVLSAVELALEVVRPESEMDVRFHEDTGLLIATGDERQLEVIDGVLSRIRESVAERRADAIQRLGRDLLEATGRLEASEAERKEAADQNLALRHEVEAMGMRTAEFHRMLDMRDRELEQAREELRAVQTRLQEALQREPSRRDAVERSDD